MSVWLLSSYLSRVIRIGISSLAFLLSVVLGVGAALFWRITEAPLDISPYVHRWLPVVVQRSHDPLHPAGRLIADKLFVQWQPARAGRPPGLMVDATNLKILRHDGSLTVKARRARLQFALSALLHGLFRPYTLRASDGFVALRRFPNGELDLDWPDAYKPPRKAPPFALTKLYDLHARNLNLSLIDTIWHKEVRLSHVQADLMRESFSPHAVTWHGQGGAMVLNAASDAVAQLSVQARALGMTGQWTFLLDTPSLKSLSDLDMSVAPWHLPAHVVLEANFRQEVRSRGSRRLAKAFLPGVNLSAVFGAGVLVQSGAPAIQIRSARAQAQLKAQTSLLKPDPAALITEIHLDIRGKRHPDIQVASQTSFQVDNIALPRVISGGVGLHASPFSLSRLDALWPPILLPLARKWVVENLTSGWAKNFALRAGVASENGMAALHPTFLNGGVTIRDADVHWRRPIPATQHVDAELTLDNINTLNIVFLSGLQPPSQDRAVPRIKLMRGGMQITGLSERQQKAAITLSLCGGLSSYLTLLATPKLELLSKHPLPFKPPKGNAEVGLQLKFPLTDHLTARQFQVDARVAYRDVAIPSLILSRDVENAQGEMQINEKQLQLQGRGMLGGTPTQIALRVKFDPRKNDPEATRLTASATLSGHDLQRAGWGDARFLSGNGDLTTVFAAKANGDAKGAVHLDMRDFGIQSLLWVKPAGERATFDAQLRFKKGELTDVPNFSLQSRDVAFGGNATFITGALQKLALTRFKLGNSSGDGVVAVNPNALGGLAIRVNAQVLDLRPYWRWLTSYQLQATTIAMPKVQGGGGAPRRSVVRQNWSLSLDAGKILLPKEGQLQQVRAHLVYQNGTVAHGILRIAKPSRVSIALSNDVNGQTLFAHIDDLGQLIGVTGSSANVKGGRVTLRGKVSEIGAGAVPTFVGNLDITSLALTHPPAILTASAHLGIVDWSDASAERLKINQVHVPLAYKDGIVTFHDGFLQNGALGATFGGKISRKEGLDINGTLVPILGLNAALGRLPSVGRLFAPEREGGLLAATFSIGGSFLHPDIAVNPLALFLPGFFRQLVK